MPQGANGTRATFAVLLRRPWQVWDYDEYDTSASQHCTHSFASHEGAINCLDLSESKVVTGSDDCLIKIWDFGK